MELKNPFALKNNRMISIADLTISERGAKCGCICPECKGHFIAAMGKILQPHFRHDGEPCDSVKALMMSLYRLLSEAISDEQRFTYPSCYIWYMGVNCCWEATLNDIINNSQIRSADFQDADLVITEKSFIVEKCEIHKNTKGIPDAIILTDKLKHHQLAVVLIPPATFCKLPSPKAFQNIPTIAIYMDGDIDLHHMKSDELKKLLRDSNEFKEWISSPTIDEWYYHLLEMQHKQHEKYLAAEAKKKKEYETRIAKQMETLQRRQQRQQSTIVTQLQSNEQHQQSVQRVAISQPAETETKKQLTDNDINRIRNQLKEKYPIIPDEIIYDDYGTRWCFCDECNIWNPEYEMAKYGGTGNETNRGMCSICARKRSAKKIKYST